MISKASITTTISKVTFPCRPPAVSFITTKQTEMAPLPFTAYKELMGCAGPLPRPLRNFINVLWGQDTIVWDLIGYSSSWIKICMHNQSCILPQLLSSDRPVVQSSSGFHATLLTSCGHLASMTSAVVPWKTSLNTSSVLEMNNN